MVQPLQNLKMKRPVMGILSKINNFTLYSKSYAKQNGAYQTDMGLYARTVPHANVS